jgi:hypothetical protein
MKDTALMSIISLAPKRTLEALQEYVTFHLQHGFLTQEEVSRCGRFRFPTVEGHAVEELVRSEVDRVLEAQSGWDAVTDCDRLAEAFRQLEDVHTTIARHYMDDSRWSFRGMFPVWEKYLHVENSPILGGVYYTPDDVQHSLESGILFLALNCYDRFKSDAELERKFEMLTSVVVDTLAQAGLDSARHGARQATVKVHLKWQKRIPTVSHPQNVPPIRHAPLFGIAETHDPETVHKTISVPPPAGFFSRIHRYLPY